MSAGQDWSGVILRLYASLLLVLTGSSLPPVWIRVRFHVSALHATRAIDGPRIPVPGSTGTQR